MPRRSQEAEDEAFAQALQEEYRMQSIQRESERTAREGTYRESDADDRLTDTDINANSTHSKRKKTKSKDKKKSKSKNSNSRSRSNSRDSDIRESGKKSKSKSNKSRSRSNSRDSDIRESGRNDRRRRRRRSGSKKASAPIESSSDWLSAYHPEQDQRSNPIPASNGFPVLPPYVVSNHDSTDGDEDYARMVQDMIRREEEERRLSQELPLRHSVFSERVESGSSFKDSNSAFTEPSTDEDEIVARRIQQELADAEYAEHISNLEQQNAASQQVVVSIERQNQLAQAQQEEQRQKSCLARWGPMTMCVIIAIVFPLLYVFDVFDTSDIPFFGDLFQDDWQGAGNITFDMINGTRVPRLPDNAIGWANTGNGLRLDVLNACSDEWQPYVQTAIANWDNGYPIDSLTLYTSREDYDPICTQVNGKLKICNGDYGDTQWRGLNEVLMSPRTGTIVSSTARLNEFYLNYEGEAQKLYTCCHELGHGFGLPHWDEDFFNKDIGNCMDYTHNPGSSSTPDDSNFIYLAQLYGGVDVRNNADLTADDAVLFFGQKEIVMDTARSNGIEKINLGNRNLFGGSGSLRNFGESFSSIALTESRLKLNDEILRDASTTRRRILLADEEAEIHVYEDPKYPGLIVMQHFLLVEPGWTRPTP